MTDPIAPLTRISQQVDNIRQIFGIQRNPAPTQVRNENSTGTGDKQNIIHRDVSSSLQRNEYKGVEIFIINGDYAGQQVFLGTDIVKVSMSQSANWEEKSGQRMRVGINFVNISPRELSFTADLYDPNGDISSVVENIAHIQEITASAGNVPPFLLIKMGDTIYENAVSTTWQPDITDPLPTITSGDNKRSGGFRRAKVPLSFKVAGGEGSKYRSAQPFNLNTEMKSIYDSKTQDEVNKQGTEAVGELLLSDCLTDSENAAFQSAVDNGGLGDPSTYLTMPTELFLQLSTAGLPDNILSDEGFIDRLKREMSVKIASQQPTGTHTTEQLASSLYTGDALAGYEGDFPALLVNYNAAVNAVLDNSIDDLDTDADSILTNASKCGRGIRDSGGLKLITEDSGTDPNFTTANINNLITNKDLTDTKLRELLGMGDRIPNQVIDEIRDHKLFESKDEFISFVGERTDGMTAQVAWANLEQKEKSNLSDINTFLGSADRDTIKDRFDIKDDDIADGIAGKTFTDKDDFLKTIYAIDKPNKTYTVKDGLDNSGDYWVQFQLQK